MTKYTGKTLWFRAAVCGFVLSVLLSFTGFSAECDLLRRNVLRLHIPANSNTAEDQAVKLRVRDAVLKEAALWYGETKDFESALASVCTHLESLEEAANRVLEAENMPYTAEAAVCDAYFPTRVYDDCKLPAGKYRTVRITLGEAEGKNWWCVLFPSVCVSGASDLDSIPEGARHAIVKEDEMRIRFKAAEIFTSLLDFFDA